MYYIKQYPIVVLIQIYLMINGVEHIMCLMATPVFSFVKCLLLLFYN